MSSFLLSDYTRSFIASGRSSGPHPISSHSCWMYVWAGRPAFAQPYVGVHRSTSLMSSSLHLQLWPACLDHLTCIVFVMGGRLPYSWCLVGCCRQDLFNVDYRLPNSPNIWICKYSVIFFVCWQHNFDQYIFSLSSWWDFPWVWVTLNLFKSLQLFSKIWTMLSFGWYLLVFNLPTILAISPSLRGSFQVDRLNLVSPSPSGSIACSVLGQGPSTCLLFVF